MIDCVYCGGQHELFYEDGIPAIECPDTPGRILVIGHEHWLASPDPIVRLTYRRTMCSRN